MYGNEISFIIGNFNLCISDYRKIMKIFLYLSNAFSHVTPVFNIKDKYYEAIGAAPQLVKYLRFKDKRKMIGITMPIMLIVSDYNTVSSTMSLLKFITL
jgi:hypothetical protein